MRSMFVEILSFLTGQDLLPTLKGFHETDVFLRFDGGQHPETMRGDEQYFADVHT